MSKFRDILLASYASSGLTLVEFAYLIDVSRATLHRYMSGQTVPDYDRACSIFEILKLKVLVLTEYEEL